MEFQPKQQRFILRGINLNRPVDLMEEGFYPNVTNLRSYIQGEIRTRPGWTSLGTTGADQQHSIKRLNDSIVPDFTLLIGAGANLYSGKTGAFTLIDSGYSGDGLTFATLSPIRTPKPWCYIGDSLRTRKVKVDGTDANWGIPAPIKAPLIQFGVPAETIIENFETTAGWVATGRASALAVNARINTTITLIVYDSGSTGWASIQPASLVNIGRGAVIEVNAEADVIVESMYPAIASTTVAAIAYDSGVSGECSIQLSAPTAKGWLKKFSMLSIGGEPIVVRDVVVGPDNIPSIRTSTVGTFSAGAAIIGLRSIRVYLTGTHAAGGTLASDALEVFNESFAGDLAVGIITKSITIDASLAADRPIDPLTDEVHLSIYVSKLKHFVDATLIVDVDDSVNDGTQNYYFKTLTVNDFSDADPTEGTSTINATRVLRLEQKLKNALQDGDFDRVRKLDKRIKALKSQPDEVLNIPIDDQSALGDNQWHELRFKTKEFYRVGTDLSRTLKDIAAIQVVMRTTKDRTFRFDSAWIGGTYGPDVADIGAPYRHIYRYKSSETGVTSAWSPPTRSGIMAHKQRVLVTPTISSDPQADKIEYARIGGVLSILKVIGTGPNSGSFNDDSTDLSLFNAEVPDTNVFQPFVIVDLPRTGTCNVAGTTITRVSGDLFDVDWARNNIIVIDNIPHTLFGPPTSTSVLHINENAGALTGVSFYLPAPELAGQPVPSIWGPLGYGQTGVFLFGCGDPFNPGDVLWTIGNDPDLMHDTNRLSVCSPSEPLIRGCIWDTRNLVFSSQRFFEIFPNFSLFPGTIGGTSQFVTQPIAGSVGLVNRFCLAVGDDGVYFVSDDGIYYTTGGTPENITDETLFNLFPHEGRVGEITNGYSPVDYTKAMTLSYYDEYVYFCYRDTLDIPFILVFNTITRGWVFDKVNPASMQSRIIYGEEGEDIHSLLLGGISAGGVGTVWRFGGTSDDTSPIICELDTKCEDNGDVRLNKEFGDYILDIDTANIAITSTPGIDNYTTMLASSLVTRAIRGISPPIDLNAGAHQLGRNFGTKLTWSSSLVIVRLYAWQFSYVIKPVNTVLRFTDWSDLGIRGPKFFHGLRLHADTLNQARSLRIQGDNGLNGVALTNVTLPNIIHNGESIIDYSFDGIRVSPFIAHLVRLAPNDANQWRLFDDFEFQFDLDSPLVLSFISQITANDLGGFQHIKSGYISHISTSDLSLVFDDDGVNSTTITIPNSGGIFVKSFFLRPAKKFKTTGYSLTSTEPFRLYKRACEFHGKSWGKNMSYQTITPVGEVHYNEGPRI